MSATEIPYTGIDGVAFTPAGPDQACARVELNRHGIVEASSGIRGFRLLRLGGSSFQGFVRDQYTTLPDIAESPAAHVARSRLALHEPEGRVHERLRDRARYASS